MTEPVFSGVCTALVTPFMENRVNYPMLDVLLQKQMDAGIPAVALAGTTGEASTLSDDEKYEIFRRAKRYVGDRCKIIAGTGSNDTLHAVHLAKLARDAGADGLLVVTPYYNKATPDGLVAHYAAIAEETNLPLIVYNVPSRTGVDIPVAVYRRLSRIPGIAGVKEASSDIAKIARILDACGEDLPVWSGNDEMTVPVISLGGKGVISVLSNVFPTQMGIMANAALAGDYVTAAALQRHYMPLIDALFCEVNPIPVKAAMKLVGLDCGNCRLPLTDLTEANLSRLKNCLL